MPTIHEQLLEQEALPPVCEVSLGAAETLLGPLQDDLRNSKSVVHAVVADRLARMSAEGQFGIAPLFLTDPSRSGVRLPRHAMQSGEMPESSQGMTPEQAVVLWAAPKEALPKLRVPEGEDARVMNLADRMQMRGGGPIVFERSEVGNVPLTPNTLVRIDGGAKNAPRERIRTAIAYAQEKGYGRPIIATVNPSRTLKPDEREAITGFAPTATNEHELFIDSAVAEGLSLDGDRYGVHHLPDGSTYATLTHQESGIRLILLAPHRLPDANAVMNSYQTLATHGADLPGLEDFIFEGTDMVAVTGTHYGAMSVMNNLLAVHDLRTTLGAYYVIGDNQASRPAQAHLIEVGLVLDAVDRKIPKYPALRRGLFPSAD